jgi:1-acyl-sn-glycerol-3-phosphate acyltransferase
MGNERKQNKFVSLGVILTSYVFLNFFYRIRVKGATNIPRRGPVLLLPKHQSFKDIPLESFIIYSQTRRMACYIMRNNLPKSFEYLGGIMSPRIMDMPKDRDKKREWIKHAQNLKAELMNSLISRLQKGAMVALHPEMTRNTGFVGEMKAALVKDIVRYARESSLGLAVIPVGINYAAPARFRSRLEVNIGKPLSGKQQDTRDIYSVVRRQLSKLSNLDYSEDNNPGRFH